MNFLLFIFGLLLLVVIFVFAIGASLVIRVLRLFGLLRGNTFKTTFRTYNTNRRSQTSPGSSSASESATTYTSQASESSAKKKIFSPQEGEYVDFEDVTS